MSKGQRFVWLHEPRRALAANNELCEEGVRGEKEATCILRADCKGQRFRNGGLNASGCI